MIRVSISRSYFGGWGLYRTFAKVSDRDPSGVANVGIHLVSPMSGSSQFHQRWRWCGFANIGDGVVSPISVYIRFQCWGWASFVIAKQGWWGRPSQLLRSVHSANFGCVGWCGWFSFINVRGWASCCGRGRCGQCGLGAVSPMSRWGINRWGSINQWGINWWGINLVSPI